MNYLASLSLLLIGYTLRCLPAYTKKWGDDRWNSWDLSSTARLWCLRWGKQVLALSLHNEL